jgi:hypothetical protein
MAIAPAVNDSGKATILLITPSVIETLPKPAGK